MTMMIPDPNDSEKEIEVYTAEEKLAIEQERDAAKAEAERYQKISAEKTENFKKLNELTEQEKATYTAKELETMARMEAAEKKAADLESAISGDKQKRIDTDTEKALFKYHGGNAELKKSMEDNFKLVALEGDDTDTIFRRAELAAAMYTGSQGGRSPLMSGFSGSAPVPKDASRTEEFMKSEKAKAAMAAMGE